MRLIKLMLAKLGKLTWGRRQYGQAASTPPRARFSATQAKPQDEADDYAYSPARYEIQVEEIDQVEFVQEWGRTVVHEALTHVTQISSEHHAIDRRLPHYDRRRPHHDRRKADTSAVQGHSRETAPAVEIDRRLPHYDRRRPDRDRRVANGGDRRVRSMEADPASGTERRLALHDRRNPGHDRRVSDDRNRRGHP